MPKIDPLSASVMRELRAASPAFVAKRKSAGDQWSPVIWRRGDIAYPPSLGDLAVPPEQLYALGDPAMLDAPRVAVVGTRDPTAYGLRMTRAIVAGLARAGVCIISGMARGIDAAAHRAALEVGGRTVAVMGTGIDVPYPVGHRELHQILAERGLVVSEYGSGVRAQRGAFPRRNRIIAALAPVTIVVEAGARSGALNTAGQALELGRTVAAVPGPIDSPQSTGTNELIRDGAAVIAAVGDALSLAGVDAPSRPRDLELEARESLVWDALGAGGLDVDTLCNRSNLPARECLAAVTTLEILGLVECLLTGEVRRR
jgi:DNA processing protein